MTESDAVIYHITSQADWQSRLAAGSYTADSLATQGFIHASTRAQVIATANRFYHGQRGLVLLEIEAARVQPEIRYERNPDGVFPHIYGVLNLAAVIRVLTFEPRADGTFDWPEE